MAFDADLLAAVDDLDQDALDQQAHDRLALLLGRRLRPPQRREVLGQGPDRAEFLRTWCGRPLIGAP
jgi:hypothetical protein